MLLPKMFSRKWLFATLLVLAGTALCIRLGIWQLDRLDQRRAFNAQFEWARAQQHLDLNNGLPDNLTEMEWRAVKVTGEYDFAHQVALRNQYNGDQYGYHLLTPLRFGGEAILVDRGWIPAEGNSAPVDWRKYDEPGAVTISGQIRLEQLKPRLGGVADVPPEDGTRLEIWNNADLTRIASQMPYPILPVYIQPKPDPGDTQPPIPFQPEIELTEGPHMGYAIQWFSFAAILFIGYPFYLRKQEVGSK
ncbi:MAG TPA: SURF1 family protein [Anaerolineales bacterium]|nr:SURF1 family protein [Anaerolineales bacterium]